MHFALPLQFEFGRLNVVKVIKELYILDPWHLLYLVIAFIMPGIDCCYGKHTAAALVEVASLSFIPCHALTAIRLFSFRYQCK